MTLPPRINFPSVFGVKDIFDSKLDEALTGVQRDAEKFEKDFKGQLDTKLGQALLALEDISARVEDYCSICHVAMACSKDDDVQKRAATLKTDFAKAMAEHCEWFEVQMVAMSDEQLEKLRANDDTVKEFSAYSRFARTKKPYMLSEELEKCLANSSLMFGPEVACDSLMLQHAKLQCKYRDPDTDEESVVSTEKIREYLASTKLPVRRAAQRALGEAVKEARLPDFATFSFNVVAGMRAYEVKLRNYKSPRSMTNCKSELLDECVNKMLEVCGRKGPELCKRFYKLKKRLVQHMYSGEDFKFCWSDRIARIKLGSQSDETYDYDECLRIVKKAFTKFSQTWGSLFERLVKEERIDAEPVSGKRGGAFCTSTSHRVGPVIVLTYTGAWQAVMTLAHEAGHANHFFLANEQRYLQQNPAFGVMEIASVFSETLVFDQLLSSETEPARRLELLVEYLSDVFNTTIRQVSFDRFEELIHNARSKGSLSTSEATQFWRDATQQWYGTPGEVFDEFDFFDDLWSEIPHFHNYPFYVYSYAFADLLVGLFYSLYKSGEVQDFPSKFENMLRGGIQQTFDEMVKVSNPDLMATHLLLSSAAIREGSCSR
eukprot:Protomagalhaensia_wolfi_Nauph_80__3849@NODE_38_length_4465_cov_20_595346_g30_i0_p1_GENE_NODE_38_length_4465_cov_20_595346_g30_i0NODE_38_length_4465_cov_20_595346_g30_i0_p1_ORF_typecomplete_len602_score121_75Peptidase_M3/PF01432_20/1_3e03Peptidase_M3/PF01432_20/2_3e41Peptidase_M3_N/PF08439_10/3_7e07NUC173/PF08161_12/1_9NUC173/PF08161_12/53ToxMPTase4/PF15640_6/2_1e03ToxMPTase4/PF15640_6/0_12Radical_SAM/PF04055_21/1_7e02Radical_SAM/PF04055_21/2_8_NODE_38_length_4465_cov_20_595346_g30_i08122617